MAYDPSAIKAGSVPDDLPDEALPANLQVAYPGMVHVAMPAGGYSSAQRAADPRSRFGGNKKKRQDYEKGFHTDSGSYPPGAIGPGTVGTAPPATTPLPPPLPSPVYDTPNGLKTMDQIKAELTASGWPFTSDDQALRLYIQVAAQAKGQNPPANTPVGGLPPVPSPQQPGSGTGNPAADTGENLGSAAGGIGSFLGQNVSLLGLTLPLWTLPVGGLAAWRFMGARRRR